MMAAFKVINQYWLISITLICSKILPISSETFHTRLSPSYFSQKLGKIGTKLIINGIDSHYRSFFARVQHLTTPGFCGAAILDSRFLITSANCVHSVKPQDIHIEIGDFSLQDVQMTIYDVQDIFIAPGFNLNNTPINDLAMIKTEEPIPDAHQISIGICDEEDYDMINYQKSVFGCCGMGSTNKDPFIKLIPQVLKEMHFRGTPMDESNPERFLPCREDNICTRPMIDGGSICNLDHGGPLYKFRCGSFEPECLYGVASYSKRKADRHFQTCNTGSFFTNLMYFHEWIALTFLQNSF
ncbi:myeloblastin-like [Convolutriloba macropyga]|uniref:myeloblastin-like n=1 Tax=Convolutriloba macropyga TaxID=536237 RepID=UPI003F527012